jgi:hypothetical protein
MIVRSRRLATTLALALAAGGLTIAVAGPAQATRSCPVGPPPPPETSLIFTGSEIEVTYITFPCATIPPGGEPTIYIVRNGVEVASGLEYVTYDCVGTAEGSFEITLFGTYEYACG